VKKVEKGQRQGVSKLRKGRRGKGLICDFWGLFVRKTYEKSGMRGTEVLFILLGGLRT
jgi:hypothetical protein